jgi:hypothetical protein
VAYSKIALDAISNLFVIWGLPPFFLYKSNTYKYLKNILKKVKKMLDYV